MQLRSTIKIKSYAVSLLLSITFVAIFLVIANTQEKQSLHSNAQSPANCSSVPFASGSNGYHTFRIPALVRTQEGTLIAFVEGRVDNPSDDGNIDIVAKRSTDGGCTWGPLQVISNNGANKAGNPAPVVDPETGIIYLIFCLGEGEGRTVFRMYSDNDGVSWSKPQEITSTTKLSSWGWVATGPGHAIALTRGAHAGRLLVPAAHNGIGGASLRGGHAIYSDDNGETWQIGYVQDSTDNVINLNESIAAQLIDGRVYFNTRDQHGTAVGNRADAYSSDGGRTLDAPFKMQPSITTDVVQGSVLQVENAAGQLLYSGPTDASSRLGMGIRISKDSGQTWSNIYKVTDDRAAYSDMVQIDKIVGLLYETGSASPYKKIEYKQIPLSSLGGDMITSKPTIEPPPYSPQPSIWLFLIPVAVTFFTILFY